DPGGGALDGVKIADRELEDGGAEILLEPREPGSARDRDDPGFPREQPGQRDLRRGRPLAFGNCGQEIDEGLVRLPVLRGEARDGVPEIAAFEGRVLVDLAGQE